MGNSFNFDLGIKNAEVRDGRPFITIYATDTDADTKNESCSEECLHGMVKKILSGGVDLLNSHYDAIGIGKAVDARIVDASKFDSKLIGHSALLVDVELDFDFPQARKLFDDVYHKKDISNKKFSIGGKLNEKNPRAIYYDRGKKVFNDLDIDHITVARDLMAINSRSTIAEAVLKTLSLTEEDESKFLTIDSEDRQMQELEKTDIEQQTNVEPDKNEKTLSWAESFYKTTKSFFSKPEHLNFELKHLPKILDKVSEELTFDFADRGGDLETVAKSALLLLQKIAGVKFDRQEAPMRVAKLLDNIESLGLGKEIKEKLATEKIFAEKEPIETEKNTKTKLKGSEEMLDKDQMELLKADIVMEVSKTVTDTVLEALKQSQLMHKVEEKEVETEVETDVEEASTDAPEKDKASEKVLSSLNELTKTLASFSEGLMEIKDRVGTLEGKSPKASTKLAGLETPSVGKNNSTFFGALDLHRHARGN